MFFYARPCRTPFSAYILEDMMEFVRAHATYRFIIFDEEEERPRLLVRHFPRFAFLPSQAYLRRIALGLQAKHALSVRDNSAIRPSPDGGCAGCENPIQNSRSRNRFVKSRQVRSQFCSLTRPLFSDFLRPVSWINIPGSHRPSDFLTLSTYACAWPVC